jgi:FixJ family two-component response regulator
MRIRRHPFWTIAMGTTVYVIDSDPEERKWIESTLARSVENISFLEAIDVLLADPPAGGTACLIASAEPGEHGALEILRRLRRNGVNLPVIALGPHTAFRTAVDIARMDATDFLERPIAGRELRDAVRRACRPIEKPFPK